MLTFSDLPAMRPGKMFLVDAAGDQAAKDMAEEFIHIMKDVGWLPDMRCFNYMAPVAGLPSSCRLLLDTPHAESVPLPQGMTQQEMAEEILYVFLPEARFPQEPTSADGGSFGRCIEVRRVRLNRRPAVLILTGWAHHQLA
jgi:hypothetical protein